MSPIKAYYDYGDKDVALLPDLAAVRFLLAEMHRDSRDHDIPLLAQLYIDGDAATPELALGVHGDVGVLSYTGRSWPGLWLSDNGTPDNGETVDYEYLGSPTEFRVNNQIPYPRNPRRRRVLLRIRR
ncbi:Imm1 family immunity protein [Actinokineospora inagensis]|uniref:Imm1 family immunity protein n=1 Tax=Actinokineospora inagensis TaxID=103730 RepID=UPI00042495DC|nr:Imm1 family immunity protein [Actinokineospora inagensis]